MSEQMEVRARQNCCRLCLAPDNECVSIYGNLLAADKETIQSKIHACVDIKVVKEDALSKKICHICISYLNCWQSFKNRCISAQRKQQEWLLGSNIGLEKEFHHMRLPSHSNESSNHGINLSTNEKPRHIPIQIKEEPIDECEENKADDDDSARCDIDPSQFLATDVIEEDDLKRLAANKNLTITKSGTNGPQILTSLGLQSIGNESVSPFAFLSASLGATADNMNDSLTETKEQMSTAPGAPSQKPHDCRICKMKFSTRANARRHERNLHGLINDMAIPPLSVSADPSSFSAQNSTPKNAKRKPNIGPLTPEMMGIYEYDKPEKYRYMFTPQKLAFIEEFEEFLIQYQTLTCKCCNKPYPKYKNFMAHMRKKYPRLPRASCFKCLKQFESKAIFVSHVKRRNCINLYKLFMNDPTFEKFNKIDKMKAKELLVNKYYECRLCPKKFRLKLEFRNHVYEDHNEMIQKKETTPDKCVFCSLKIDDSVERKRHYNNMECILHIRCSTCNTKFETHQTFLEHVYKDHVPLQVNSSRDSKPSNLLSDSSSHNFDENKIGFSPQKVNQNESTPREVESVPPVKTQFHSRMPQNCKICGARYNNYNNVLRHMEAKHPDQLPQTYKCSLCFVGFPRLSNLREHMWDVHNKKLAKPKRDAEIYCRICLEKFTDKDSWVTHQTEQHDRYICCICFSQYDDVTIFKEHIKLHTSLVNSKQQVAVQNSPSVSQDSTKYTGRFDYVMKDLMSITNGSGGGNNTDNDNTMIEEPPAKKLKFENENNQLMDLSKSADTSVQQIQTNNVAINSNNDQTAPKPAPKLFECELCHSAFNSSQGLSNHKRAHYAQEMARNSSLGLQTATKIQNNNQSSEHENKFIKNNKILALENRFRRMRCRLCQKRFSSKKVYRRHMLVDHHVQNVQFIHCAICRAEFAHEKGLKVHMIKIHGKILRDIGIENLQYECDVCSIVYKTEEELMNHKQSVHNLENVSINNDGAINVNNNNNNNNSININNNNDNINSNNINNNSNLQTTDNNLYWFQCRYCASNFDSNKKLAIHINIHDEFDSTDYSCKDCGNVYSGRKSLWVHRYKKHPVLPSPTFCDMCNKMFFTKEHLEFHRQNLHKIPSQLIETNKTLENDIKMNESNTTSKYTGDIVIKNEDKPEEGDENRKEIIHVSGEDVQTLQVPLSHGSQLPQVPCSVCQMKFSDEEAFTKHMKIHEESFFTDNPLASMFDTEPEDPDLILQKRINENGEFVCDICPKTFQQLTALKVHRNWHFRSDGKQIPADPNIWHSIAKKRKPSSSIYKCQHCLSTFTSSINLKIHVMEMHKELSNNNTSPDSEQNLQCKKCSLYFKSHSEWVEHKIGDLKQELSNNSNEWVCDICGKVVTRKDRLIQHMYSHLKDTELKQSNEKKLHNIELKSDLSESNSNSRDILSQNDNDNKNTLSSEDKNVNDEKSGKRSFANAFDEKESKISSEYDSDSESDSDNENSEDGKDENDHEEDDDEDDDDDDDDGEEDEDEDEEDRDEYNDDINGANSPHSCDLCQKTFDTAQLLTAHVPTHFFHQTPIEVRNEAIEGTSSKSDGKIEEIAKPIGENIVKGITNNIQIKLEKNESEQISLPSLENESQKIIMRSQIDIKNEFHHNDNPKERTKSPLAIKKELNAAEMLNQEPKKQIDKLIINRKDLTIKQENLESNHQTKTHLSRESVEEIISDTDEDDDDDDDEDVGANNYNFTEINQNNVELPEQNLDGYDSDEHFDHEYVSTTQPITEDGPDIVSTNQTEDENDEKDDNKHSNDSNEDDEMAGGIVGEEIVHDDNAEYHEHNVVDLSIYSDSESNNGERLDGIEDEEDEIDDEDDDEDDGDDGNTENYEHFIYDDDEDEDDDDDNHSEQKIMV